MSPQHTPLTRRFTFARTRLAAAALAAGALLTACGGDSTPIPTSVIGEQSGLVAQQCSANNPFRADSDAGTNPTPGTLTIEKQWARAYVNEAYLWYNQVPSINASLAAYSTESDVYGSLDNYFSDLTVNPIADDRFSFTYPTRAWKELSQQGITLSYGIEFSVASSTIPRVIRVAYIEPGSPAAQVGLQRGDQITSVDGFSINDNTTAGINAINEGVFPSVAGSHTLGFSRNGAPNGSFTLPAAALTLTPVPTTRVVDTGSGRVGYILFNDHILTAEDQLVNAFRTLQSAGVNDVVLDLRYNRGGFLFLASQVSYMVAGPVRTNARTFERLRYNDKRLAETNSTNSITPFYNVTRGGSLLPTLNLNRVWVLSGRDTCSASESIVNGLRGIGVQVNLIGGTTCGKPYGFTAKDNCGISYFPIEFQGVNDAGFGDYGNGFGATCAASDDFSRDLGDPLEGRLAAALYHRANNSCNAAFAQGKPGEADGYLRADPARSNKFLMDFKSAPR